LLAPLLRFADATSWGGEDGVLRALFAALPRQAGFAIEFGQRSVKSGTVATLVDEQGWSALYMDVAAPEGVQRHALPTGGTATVARERIAPSNINALFQKYGVPSQPDCLVIDIDGLDLWVWAAIESAWQPAVVVVEYNVHAGPLVEASIRMDESWSYGRTKDYGASFSALRTLAQRKGYRLVHVHGPWNLYFLRNDLEFPSELTVRQEVTAQDFATLTDTVGFYDTLCGGKRPSWMEAPPPDLSRDPWIILVPDQASQRIDIAGVALQVLSDKHDVQWYQQRKVHEERHSLLYPLLAAGAFRNVIDVGANVGMISIFARMALPEARLVCVEADPRLVQLLRRNLAQHGIHDAVVVNAVAGQADRGEASFSLNPRSTLDNRVSVERWDQVHVPSVNMSRLLEELAVDGRTFLKIDTQGFELHVLTGLEGFLQRQHDWLLKMEFAPDWLESQGTDPMAVLDYLQARYEIAELLERIPYGLDRLEALFTHRVTANQHQDFVRHVRAQNGKGLGWVDLVVRPRRSGPHAANDSRVDRHSDRFSGLPAPELLAQLAGQKWFHDMQLPGARTGSWVYPSDLPPNYHLFPVWRYLNELSLQGSTCLDIGTYDGMTAFSLAARGAAQVDATCQFDLDRFRIARALGGWPQVAYFPQTDLDDIHARFNAAHYDLVVMSAMLHHLLSPLEGLIEARRLLKPGGWLLVEVVIRDGHEAEVQLNTALTDPVYGQPTIWIPSEGAFDAMLRFAGLAPHGSTRLIGTRLARETNYDRITVLARATDPRDIEGRTPALQELHRKVRQIGQHKVAPDIAPDAAQTNLPCTSPAGQRVLNPWFEQPVDPLQPTWSEAEPARATFARVAENTDFTRLAGRHRDGAFTAEDLRHRPSRYPGEVMPEGMRWGLKQLGYLHVLDHVRDWGLVDVLEAGPGFNLYFPRHLPAWCRYTGLDDGGFYDEQLIAGAEAHQGNGRRVRGLLGKPGHALDKGVFDACVSVSVLEHVPDDDIDEVCSDMFALLRPGGWALHSIDLPPSQMDRRGQRWLQALQAAGFVVRSSEVNTEPGRTAAPFCEPLSIVTTFYAGYQPHIWGNAQLKGQACPFTLLVAMRKPPSVLHPAPET
jgi:FkbM family methyltransferase